MDTKRQKWIFLCLLSVIWGSSFILIKKGLIGLSAYQLGSIRIIFTSLFLFIIGFRSVKKIRPKHYKPIIISAFLGTFIPVYMFALAETEIDSAIVSILNSLTPLNTLLFGFMFFKMTYSRKQFSGVVIGFLGTLLLIISGANLHPNQNYLFSGFVLIASVCYAFNVSIIKKYLQDLNPMSIAVGNFAVICIPAFVVLVFTGFFNFEIIKSKPVQTSLLYIVLLAIFGTAVAKVMFNRLVQISTPIFSSSVTYTIPLVALLWGFLDGEKLNFIQIIAAIVILLGVYLSNRN